MIKNLRFLLEEQDMRIEELEEMLVGLKQVVS
jgi:hypothetical protein